MDGINEIREPRILYADLETLPNIAATWGVWKQNVPADFLLKERSIICGQYFWEGEGETVDDVKVISIGDKPRKFKSDPHDDEHVVKGLYKVFSKADIIIGHNFDKFDLKYFNTRAIYHGLPPLPKVITIDTLKAAKKRFRFNFNRLDYLGELLGVGRKLPTTANLWVGILSGDKESLKYMEEYGKQDIVLLRDVYLKLKPYIENHPNLNVIAGARDLACPKCMSTNYIRRGEMSTNTGKYPRYSCKDCGGWFSHKTAILTNPSRSR